MTEPTHRRARAPKHAISLGALAEDAVARAKKRIPEFAEGVSDADVESVHEFRVETRRLRVALATFQGVFRGRGHRSLGTGLRDVGRALAPLRDAQVFATEVLVEENLARLELDVAERLLEATHDRIARLAKKAKRRMRSDETRDVLDALDALRVDASDVTSAPATSRARAALVAWHDAASERAARVERSDEASIHAFRRSIRRLRYAVAIVAPAFDRRDVDPFLEEVGSLRDVLGAYRDASVARDAILAIAGAERGRAAVETLVHPPRFRDIARAIARFESGSPFFRTSRQSPRASTK